VERLYLDTNVLFPMTLMDLMLSMAEDFHHDLLWSDFLLAEWERVIVREQRRTPEQASAITSAIRQAFPSGRIASDDYESIIETVPPRSRAAPPRSLPPIFAISTATSSPTTASSSRPPRAISSGGWSVRPIA
jgi:hypothetical protein